MGQHPLNLGLRFLLEIAALVAIGYWAWHRFDDVARIALTIALPLLAATLWGTLRVPGDGGAPLVAVAGPIRLVFELALFAFATWALHNAGAPISAWVLGGVTLFHYIISYDRIGWLLRQ